MIVHPLWYLCIITRLSIIYIIRYNNRSLNMSALLDDVIEQVKNDPDMQITPEYLENWFKEHNIEDSYHYLVNKTLQILFLLLKQILNYEKRNNNEGDKED